MLLYEVQNCNLEEKHYYTFKNLSLSLSLSLSKVHLVNFTKSNLLQLLTSSS